MIFYVPCSSVYIVAFMSSESGLSSLCRKRIDITGCFSILQRLDDDVGVDEDNNTEDDDDEDVNDIDGALDYCT